MQRRVCGWLYDACCRLLESRKGEGQASERLVDSTDRALAVGRQMGCDVCVGDA